MMIGAEVSWTGKRGADDFVGLTANNSDGIASSGETAVIPTVSARH